MIHLLLLGAVTHSILVWSAHFTDAFLHCAPREVDQRLRTARLLVLNLGVLAVVTGVPAHWWPLTVAGALSVGAAVTWHGGERLVQARRALPSRFRATVRYYVAAATCLPLGATLGTLLARDPADPWHGRLILAHAVLNVLGWMGLTVVGTLVTLWPTMLRTRIPDGYEAATRTALPLLLAAVLLAATSSVAGWRLGTALGLATYLLGLGGVLRGFLAAARSKRPQSYPTWAVLAAVSWLVAGVGALLAAVLSSPTWTAVGDRFDTVTPLLAAGFGGQVLLGATSYLVPVVLGGGPTPVRAANAVLARAGALRIVLVNGGLLVSLLPVTGPVRSLCWAGVALGLAGFLPLMVLAMRASRRAKASSEAGRADGTLLRPSPAPVPPSPSGSPARWGSLVAGVAALALAVGAGTAVAPAGRGDGGSASAVAATGRTTTVQVRAEHMRFVPSTVTVPAGDRLVVVLTNADPGVVHDLTFGGGRSSPRIAPGGSARVDLGVVRQDAEGWCSVVGHRQLGMVLHVRVSGPAARLGTPAGSSGRTPAAVPSALDLHGTPPPGFTARDAVLPPLEEGRVHRRTITVREVEREVAPGVRQRLWTFDGTAPGPVLHGRVGDDFDITLVNAGSMGHSIDFHAGALAPDAVMRTIAPGQSLRYRFTAARAGVWLYHCSTMPMSAHIANGMFGAVVIEPPGLPRVDRSYVLVQSELYLGAQGGHVDLDKLQAERPDAVVFNGYANQYDARPLAARVGERVRVWVLDAGPDRASSFHVVGSQFDTTYLEGAYTLRPGQGGSQTLSLGAAQGGFVELTFPEPGRYPFVTHVMVDAERGARGVFAVSAAG